MAEVTNSLQVVADIRNFVDRSIVVGFSILEPVTNSFIGSYDIKLVAAQKVVINYPIEGGIRKSIGITYAIDSSSSLVFRSFLVNYIIEAPVATDLCNIPTLMSPNRIYKVSGRTCQY